jgi:predicted nucleic acid-binding protein
METGSMAGALRARYGLPLPDAFQAAAAIEGGSNTIVTNDRDFRRIREVKVLLLEEIAG